MRLFLGCCFSIALSALTLSVLAAQDVPFFVGDSLLFSISPVCATLTGYSNAASSSIAVSPLASSTVALSSVVSFDRVCRSIVSCGYIVCCCVCQCSIVGC